jgi:predicted flap endonuclease-1-like 5' DNA nuclease
VQPRFFCGQLLTDHDLTALVGWTRDKFALARRRDGWGVVCGLDVRCASDARNPLRVRVTPGYAVSCCGDDIVVCEEATLDLSDACREEEDPCADLRRQLRETRDGGQAARAVAGRARAYGGSARARAARASRDVVAYDDAGGADGDVLENFRAVDIFLRYAEKPAGPATAFGRSACKETPDCEFSRTEESYALGWLLGQQNTDPVERAARRWHEGYDKCLDVLRDFRGQFSFDPPPSAGDVRRWLVNWMEQHPLTQFCHLRDEICRATSDDLTSQTTVTRWLFGLVQDCRNAYLACDCAGCERGTGVPLARVWLHSADGRWGRESCRVAQIDPYPPYRRPLAQDCWPAPLGYVNVGRAIWHRWDEACTMLDDLGLSVTSEEFEIPDTLEALEEALDCDLFVGCEQERVARVLDFGPLGRRVVGFCAGEAAPAPAVTLDVRCERYNAQTASFVPATEARPNDLIHYIFEAANPSTLDLSNVSVSDTLTGFSEQNQQLPAGTSHSWVSQNRYVRDFTDAAGVLHNEATVSGETADGQAVTDTDAHDLTIINAPPSLSLTLTAQINNDGQWQDVTETSPANQVRYVLTAENTGTVDLVSLSLGETVTGFSAQNLQLPAGQTLSMPTGGRLARTLGMGVVHNEATATGQSADGQGANATATHDLTVGFSTQPGPSGVPRPQPTDEVAVRRDEVPVRRDDFTAIRGIGEARATTLHEAGINTFAQLAAAPIEKLHELFGGINNEVLRQWVADAKAIAR